MALMIHCKAAPCISWPMKEKMEGPSLFLRTAHYPIKDHEVS